MELHGYSYKSLDVKPKASGMQISLCHQYYCDCQLSS